MEIEMKMSSTHRRVRVAVGAAVLGFTAVAAADVVYVDQSAPAGGDGTSWASAFDTFYDAIIAASAGDEIWVAAGTYLGATLKDGVAILGGFAGDETSSDERDWTVNETTLGPVNALQDEDAVLDGFTTGRIWLDTTHAVVRNCRIIGQSGFYGGGIEAHTGSLVLESCTVTDNIADHSGGGIDARYLSTLVIRDCVFSGNTAEVGAGAAFLVSNDEVLIERSVFTENASYAIGGVAIGSQLPGDQETVSAIRDSSFIGNVSDTVVGGIGVDGETTFVNCAFVRNQATLAAGVTTTTEGATFINCTFAENNGDAIYAEQSAILKNCIAWGNVPVALAFGPYDVSYSNIQGGWSGEGNIDADPLFVQVGTGDVRLAEGSPCIDAGDSKAVPPDVLTDLAGNPRIIGAAVDMGAYEGAYDAQPPSALVGDLDEGEVVFLIPDGTGYDPMSLATVVIRNLAGGDDAMVEATEYAGSVHPGAGGFTELAHVMTLEGTLDPGTFIATVSIPFTAADLGGVDPLDVDLTVYDAVTGNWALAAIGNTADSPGHTRRFGDRIVTVSSGGFTLSQDLGDYGVVWNPDEERGFAWALVDHSGDFALGAPMCAADAAQPPNGWIGFEDLELVLASWGAGDGPFDVDGSGSVDAVDLMTVLGRWGVCAP